MGIISYLFSIIFNTFNESRNENHETNGTNEYFTRSRTELDFNNHVENIRLRDKNSQLEEENYKMKENNNKLTRGEEEDLTTTLYFSPHTYTKNASGNLCTSRLCDSLGCRNGRPCNR